MYDNYVYRLQVFLGGLCVFKKTERTLKITHAQGGVPRQNALTKLVIVTVLTCKEVMLKWCLNSHV